RISTRMSAAPDNVSQCDLCHQNLTILRDADFSQTTFLKCGHSLWWLQEGMRSARQDMVQVLSLSHRLLRSFHYES
ncbi:hypothetical protein PFISCL1PPCAC_21539, partial [Pristionchus fissidentatus]